MLVLTRQPSQKVSFPSLGISVEILNVKGSRVRIGIDAPTEVRVIRDELSGSGEEAKYLEPCGCSQLPSEMRDDLSSTLHALGMMLQVYRQRCERLSVMSGDGTDACRIDAESIYDAMISRIDSMLHRHVLSQQKPNSRPVDGKPANHPRNIPTQTCPATECCSTG